MSAEREIFYLLTETSPSREVFSADEWVIEPRRAGVASRVREVWQYRHLLRFFGTQTLEKRYRRTVLGKAWLFIRSLFPVAISSLVFGHFIGIQTGEVPYFLFFLVGMTSWSLFSESWLWATRSLELNRGLLRKVYFPRIILPFASVSPALVDFLISLALIAGAILYLGMVDGKLHLRLGWSLLLAAFAAALNLLFAIGLGLWTSVWGANARDIRFSLGYVLSFWFYLTPVIYPSSIVADGRWSWIVSFNPMAPLVETFKWGILGVGQFDSQSLVVASAIVAVTLLSGLWFFHKAEATSIDKL